MSLDNIKNIYIIGIEGAGTSALALILQSQGKNVVGSDDGDHFYYDVLKKAGIKVWHKFDKNNLTVASNEEVVPRGGAEQSEATGDLSADEAEVRPRHCDVKKTSNKIDLIIYSTAIQPETNPELKYAMEIASKAGLIESSDSGTISPAFGEQFNSSKILSYPQALAMVFNNSNFGIAVCGTHGKTTTTAMLATAMQKAGANLTALVGSKVLEWGGGVLTEGVDYFVIEADEYQNKLQYYNPQAVILTSADYDHPDFFKTEEEYKQAFKDFVVRIPKNGFLVAYAGDKNVLEISKSAQCEVIFYDSLAAQEILLSDDFCSLKNKVCRGKTFGCCPVMKEVGDRVTKNNNKGNKGDKENESNKAGEVRLFGEHNLLNAMASFRVCQKLGLDLEIVKKSLREFQGTARRFEFKGEYNGAVIIDDYAHHPVEVEATLKSAKERYPNKKIKVIFHPHTFTRTMALLDEFAKSFTLADEIYLLDIFGSAREKQGRVSSDDLVEKIRQNVSAGEVIPRGGVVSDGRGATSTGTESVDILNNNKTIKNLHTIPEVTKYFQKNLTKNDLLITMGAGDVYLVGEGLVKNNN